MNFQEKEERPLFLFAANFFVRCRWLSKRKILEEKMVFSLRFFTLILPKEDASLHVGICLQTISLAPLTSFWTDEADDEVIHFREEEEGVAELSLMSLTLHWDFGI